jgi:hypothetical protein
LGATVTLKLMASTLPQSGKARPLLFTSSLRSIWTCDLLLKPYLGRGEVGCQFGIVVNLSAGLQPGYDRAQNGALANPTIAGKIQ